MSKISILSKCIFPLRNIRQPQSNIFRTKLQSLVNVPTEQKNLKRHDNLIYKIWLTEISETWQLKDNINTTVLHHTAQ